MNFISQKKNGLIASCFDDLFSLNLRTFEWINIPSLLSPLPRKGHTISLCKLKSSSKDLSKLDSAVLFGGYSSEKNLMSNSLHLCNLDEGTFPYDLHM